jgi:D-alanyl-D-alanine carboxypeptidase
MPRHKPGTLLPVEREIPEWRFRCCVRDMPPSTDSVSPGPCGSRARRAGVVRRPVALGAAFSVALAPASAGARPSAGVASPPSLRQLAKGLVAAGSPGAIVYVRGANGARAGAAGYASLRTKERLGAGHVFRIGSVTKTFVATVVLQLEAEGVLRPADARGCPYGP